MLSPTLGAKVKSNRFLGLHVAGKLRLRIAKVERHERYYRMC